MGLDSKDNMRPGARKRDSVRGRLALRDSCNRLVSQAADGAEIPRHTLTARVRRFKRALAAVG